MSMTVKYLLPASPSRISSSPLGFYEYERMPFGLANSPATYQRLMETILQDLNLKICFVYLDGVIIFSDTYEEHLQPASSSRISSIRGSACASLMVFVFSWR
jgi:hypothetical protein